MAGAARKSLCLLAGGTANAGYVFHNEGVDLGQRAYEIAAFNDSVIAPSGEPLYSSYWLPLRTPAPWVSRSPSVSRR